MFFFWPHVLNSAGKLWPPEVLTSLMPWAAIVHGFRPMRFYIREVRTRRNHGWQIVGNCWKSSFCSISVQNTIAREHSVINLYTNSNFTGAKLTISEYLKYSRTVFPRCIEHNHAIASKKLLLLPTQLARSKVCLQYLVLGGDLLIFYETRLGKHFKRLGWEIFTKWHIYQHFWKIRQFYSKSSNILRFWTFFPAESSPLSRNGP